MRKKGMLAVFMALMYVSLSASWECAWDEGISGAENKYDTASMLMGETSVPKICVISLIACYQALLSGKVSSSCNFYPSCSGYAAASVSMYGSIAGLIMAVDRLTRCNNSAVYSPYDFFHEKKLLLDRPEDAGLTGALMLLRGL